MKIPEKFKEYIWLVQTISRSRSGLTLNEINEQWLTTDMSRGVAMARNTFLRHKAAIEEMFGLYIECDTHNQYRYYIGNEHVHHEDSVQNWLLQTLTVGNLVSSSLNMQDRILLEHVSMDSALLEQLVDAMRRSCLVALDYQPYGAGEARHHDNVAPYCLKMFRRRWYVLGQSGSGHFRVFALDRIRQLKTSRRHFTMDPYFDADDYFSECFGVVAGDGTRAERIVVRAFGREQHALADLPLHHTQRRLATAADHTDYELTLRPTADFVAHLLSRGRWLRVVQPQWLADDVRRQHLEAAEPL